MAEKRSRMQASAPPYLAVTHRPLTNLAFLLPFAAAYELGMALLHPALLPSQRPDLAAPQLLRHFFSLFGASGYYLPGLALVAVLVAWHAATREPWRLHLTALPVMAMESLLWAVPLYVMNDFVKLTALAAGRGGRPLDDLVLGIGAGIYEELLFRLMLITLLVFIFIDVFRLREVWGTVLALVISSLLFAAHHYPPVGTDEYHAAEFAFRFIAGGYLAFIFVSRGFGISVGAHVMYNVIVYMTATF